MRRNIPRWCLLIAALAPVPLVAQPREAAAQAAPEGDSTTWKSHFDNGVALFHEGDYRAALTEFRRAYELSHNYRVLYNVAQTEFEVQDYAGALRTFKKYLTDGGAEIEADRRTQVEGDIKKLAGRVATVTISSGTAGAEVLVDDVPVGRTPLSEPLTVSAGLRKITLQKGDLAPVSRVVEVAGGDSTSVIVNLSEPQAQSTATVGAPALTAPAPSLSPTSQPAPSRAGFWVAFSGAAALTAGGAVAGVLAIDSYNDTKAKIATRNISAADIEAAHSKTATLSIVADVLGGAAVAMGVVTLVVGLTGSSSQPRPQKVDAKLRLGPQGIALTGQF